MSSSEGEDFLNSADVNEEFSFDDDQYEGEGQGYENEMEEEDSGVEEDSERQKYAEELEYEDVGEPATFNFNIHNGNISTASIKIL